MAADTGCSPGSLRLDASGSLTRSPMLVWFEVVRLMLLVRLAGDGELNGRLWKLADASRYLPPKHAYVGAADPSRADPSYLE